MVGISLVYMPRRQYRKKVTAAIWAGPDRTDTMLYRG